MERASWLVVGLGNPGPDYAQNRHNIGFMIVDQLVERWGGRTGDFRSKFGSELLQLDHRGHRVHAQKPMEYMNVSGGAVQRALAFFKLDPAHLIVVHDDIDLPFGKVRVKIGGGHGGHNGVRSIGQSLGPEFVRVRAGVGRPGGSSQADKKDRVVGFVLGNFGRGEQKELADELQRACEAIELVLEEGVTAAMNRVNGPEPGAKPAKAAKPPV